ncbi:MAG: prephenate dehydratase [Rikenellaceae bacterium]
MKKVTIQGVEGCYHEVAARRFFAGEEIGVLPCATFGKLFDAMASDKSLLGIAAIENTIAGSLLQNHELLSQSNLKIIGEQKIRISHVVAVLPGQKIEQIREVHSHPIALMQCATWLSNHPTLKAVESDDTAESAKIIAEQGLEGHAAICGEWAAELYGLEIIERAIETNRHNFTRFLILSDSATAEEYTQQEEINKASIQFSLAHSTGSLSKILTIFSFYDINLTKIQSLPIIGCEWEYLFYVDLTFDNLERYRQALDAVRPLITDFKVLGEYREAATPSIDINNIK